jgi:hypothetical protein
MISGTDMRRLLLGTLATKETGTLAATTVALFTITGGVVQITQMFGVVTTAITVANSYKIQANPTTGTTTDMVAATDIGTTDTPAGNILSFTGVKTDSIIGGPGSCAGLAKPILVTTGQIEHVSAGTDGAITWYVTWVPVDTGAALVAA